MVNTETHKKKDASSINSNLFPSPLVVEYWGLDSPVKEGFPGEIFAYGVFSGK